MDTGKKIIFSLALIVLGIILLLNNFNLLPGFFWLVYLRFWPFYLIIIGIRLLLPRETGLGVLLLLVALLLPLVFSFTSFGQNLLRERANYGSDWEFKSNYEYFYPRRRNNIF